MLIAGIALTTVVLLVFTTIQTPETSIAMIGVLARFFAFAGTLPTCGRLSPRGRWFIILAAFGFT